MKCMIGTPTQLTSTWDLGFLQKWLWRLLSFGMWCRVVWYMPTFRRNLLPPYWDREDDRSKLIPEDSNLRIFHLSINIMNNVRRKERSLSVDHNLCVIRVISYKHNAFVSNWLSYVYEHSATTWPTTPKENTCSKEQRCRCIIILCIFGQWNPLTKKKLQLIFKFRSH
jgi:hypothetical protein